MQATSSRVTRTASVISHMKSIKVAGLDGLAFDKIRNLRKDEINQSVNTRLTGTLFNMSGRSAKIPILLPAWILIVDKQSFVVLSQPQ